MNKYRLYWIDKSYEDIQGNSIEDAFINAGYDEFDIQAVNFWYLIIE